MIIISSCKDSVFQAEAIGYKGNILIDRLMGSQIVLCPCNSDEGDDHKNLELFTEEYTELLRYDNCYSMSMISNP